VVILWLEAVSLMPFYMQPTTQTSIDDVIATMTMRLPKLGVCIQPAGARRTVALWQVIFGAHYGALSSALVRAEAVQPLSKETS
jgi:hypothetical protein